MLKPSLVSKRRLPRKSSVVLNWFEELKQRVPATK